MVTPNHYQWLRDGYFACTGLPDQNVALLDTVEAGAVLQNFAFTTTLGCWVSRECAFFVASGERRSETIRCVSCARAVHNFKRWIRRHCMPNGGGNQINRIAHAASIQRQSQISTVPSLSCDQQTGVMVQVADTSETLSSTVDVAAPSNMLPRVQKPCTRIPIDDLLELDLRLNENENQSVVRTVINEFCMMLLLISMCFQRLFLWVCHFLWALLPFL
jgi:hypothetical protein